MKCLINYLIKILDRIINVFKERLEFKEKDLIDTCKMSDKSILARLLIKEKYNIKSYIDLAIVSKKLLFLL